MKKYSFFFFYYLLISLTTLLFGSIFFAPMPYKLIQTIILLPATAYLWLRFTSPESALENQWAGRLVVVVATLVLCGGGIYYLSTDPDSIIHNQQVQTNDDLKPYLESQIQDIKNQISTLKQTSKETPKPSVAPDPNKTFEVLSEQDGPTPQPAIGKIKIAGSKDVNVYSETNKQSQILGVGLQGEIYNYAQKKNGWYQIDYDTINYGWISDSSIQEVK
jgi:hypothetical protein